MVAAVAVLALGAGVWYFVLRDTAAPQARLDAIGSATSTSGSGPERASADGTWKVQPGPDVFVGYRILELFAGQTIKKTATGRTAKVEGTLTVSGATISLVAVKADVAGLKSDEDRRDAALRQRGLQTAPFPEASFTLAQPITLAGPGRRGEEVSVTARGNLTLHGVTKPVEIGLQAKWNGDSITVAGSSPIVLGDFGIEQVDVPGLVKVDDHGTLELQLVFVPA